MPNFYVTVVGRDEANLRINSAPVPAGTPCPQIIFGCTTCNKAKQVAITSGAVVSQATDSKELYVLSFLNPDDAQTWMTAKAAWLRGKEIYTVDDAIANEAELAELQ